MRKDKTRGGERGERRWEMGDREEGLAGLKD